MYDAYFGLTGRPFQLTPDPDFYFQSQTHRKAMSYLGYGLAQGEGFIVITGEIGAGKTTLVGHLMQTIDTARLTAAQIVTTQVASRDLLHLVAQAFGLETAGMDKAAVLRVIEQFLHSEARAGRRCLLVVDESQNLPVTSIEELRMLSNFQLGSQALLQIFLLGQPEFRDMVQSSPELEQLRQRVIAMHHLSAMERSEIQPYIEHRLGKVGWNGQPQFTPDVFARLYDASAGIPRKINTIASRALLMGAVEQADTIDSNMVDAVLADMAGDTAHSTPAMAHVAEEYEESEIADDYAVEETQVEIHDEPVSETEQHGFAAAQDMPHTPPMADKPAMPEMVMHGYDDTSAIETAVQADSGYNIVTDSDVDMLKDRIASLEMRVSEQEDAIKRTLAMLIDWVENDDIAREMLQSKAA